MTNPLLTLDGPPDFRAIEPAHIAPAIESLLAEARAAGPDVPVDYDSVATALDVPVERLGLAWNVVSHLHAVADTPALRASYFACLPQVTAFYTALRGDVGLYRKYAAIAQDPALTPAQARAVALAVQSAQLSGAELEGAPRQGTSRLQDTATKQSHSTAWSLGRCVSCAITLRR